MLPEKLKFLQSTRFWALVLIGVIKALEAEAIIPSEVADSLIIILGGYIGIRSFDKAVDAVRNSNNGVNNK